MGVRQAVRGPCSVGPSWLRTHRGEHVRGRRHRRAARRAAPRAGTCREQARSARPRDVRPSPRASDYRGSTAAARDLPEHHGRPRWRSAGVRPTSRTRRPAAVREAFGLRGAVGRLKPLRGSATVTTSTCWTGSAPLFDNSLVGHRELDDGSLRFHVLETIREFASGRTWDRRTRSSNCARGTLDTTSPSQSGSASPSGDHEAIG